MRPDTIAFISTYEHPSRDSVERMMRDAFPEYRFEHIVLKDVVKRHRRWLPLNILFTIWEYGPRILRRDISFRVAFFQTSYVVEKVHEAMQSLIDPARHVFSFQTQSMYDSSAAGVPHFVYTDHTHLSNLESIFFDRRQLRLSRWRALERKIYHHAARVFTRSRNVTADLKTHYAMPPAKVVCVYAGANVEVKDDELPQNSNYGNRRILFVGRDWVRKGGPELVAAFQEALRVVPDAHLTIIGAQPSLSVPNCTVLGDLPLGEMSRHFAQSSIFCLPTRSEPFGIVVLEAMLHRLPVVGSSEGALPDMIGDGVTGRIVAPGDVPALAAALIDLLKNPARCRAFGNAGYRLARERYTWPAVGKRLRSEIMGVINPV